MEFRYLVGWINQINFVDYLHFFGLGTRTPVIVTRIFNGKKVGKQHRWRRSALPYLNTLTLRILIFIFQVFKSVLFVGADVCLNAHARSDVL